MTSSLGDRLADATPAHPDARAVLWEPLAWLTWPVYGLLVLGNVTSDDQVLYCPFGKKRVKVGARACHHCGRDSTWRRATSRTPV